MANLSKTILIAEDSAVQATVVRRIVSGAGYTVLMAKDGREALNLLSGHHVDLMLLDVEMPEINGFQLCLTAKRDPRLQSIPIILVTSFSDPSALLGGIEAGADSYITKPANPETLLERIREFLEYPLLPGTEPAEEVIFQGKRHLITADRQHLLNFLLSAYERMIYQNQQLAAFRTESERMAEAARNASEENERLLRSIFLDFVADDLIAYGSVRAVAFKRVTVMFTDFHHFTQSAERLAPDALIGALEVYFNEFDDITERHNLRKIKTTALVDGFFVCELRGMIPAKNKGNVPMYFIKRIRPELSADEAGTPPNSLFMRKYNLLKRLSTDEED